MHSSYKFIVLLSILILSAFFIKATKDTTHESEIKKNNIITDKSVSENYNIKSVTVPENLDFAGEKVPLEIQDVYERMDRELHVNTYWQSNTLIYAKRANKYFPVIEKILAENGIPEDFKYLALIESGLRNVVSPAGAKGFWQIMKATGKGAKLEINDNIDERYHLEKSTKVACDYLNSAYKRFGSWTVAAASYNMGKGGVNKQLTRQQTDNYYDLLLSEETSRYLFRILAVKEILKNPKKYGFSYSKEDLYKPLNTYTIEVDSVIHNLADYAKYYGINYKELKLLNPWLIENKLNNASKRKYSIALPRE